MTVVAVAVGGGDASAFDSVTTNLLVFILLLLDSLQLPRPIHDSIRLRVSSMTASLAGAGEGDDDEGVFSFLRIILGRICCCFVLVGPGVDSCFSVIVVYCC
jgi:hypothetical protein